MLKQAINANLYKSGSTNVKGKTFPKLLFRFKSIEIKIDQFFH